MYMDSQITEDIIRQFVAEKKPILTVHDSYIVKTKDTEYLHQTMAKATSKLLGVELAVEQLQPSYANIMYAHQHERHTIFDLLENITNNKDKTEQYEERLARFLKKSKKRILRFQKSNIKDLS